MKDVKKALEPYAHVTDYVWCQEEPLNQGAWYCSKHNFESAIPESVKLKYAGRPASARLLWVICRFTLTAKTVSGRCVKPYKVRLKIRRIFYLINNKESLCVVLSAR